MPVFGQIQNFGNAPAPEEKKRGEKMIWQHWLIVVIVIVALIVSMLALVFSVIFGHWPLLRESAVLRAFSHLDGLDDVFLFRSGGTKRGHFAPF